VTDSLVFVQSDERAGGLYSRSQPTQLHRREGTAEQKVGSVVSPVP
jgi:hypothetical protein